MMAVLSPAWRETTQRKDDSWLLQFNLQSYSRFTNNKNDFSTEETN